MNVLELFAGSRSIGKASKDLGHNVFSSDLNSFDGIDYAVDILDFNINKVPFKPDLILVSVLAAINTLNPIFANSVVIPFPIPSDPPVTSAQVSFPYFLI